MSFDTSEGNQLSDFQNDYFFKIHWWCHEPHNKGIYRWENKIISECFTINNCGYTFVSFYGIQSLVQEFYENSDQNTNWKCKQPKWRNQMWLLQKVFDPVVQWKPRISISFATIKTVQQCCPYTFLFICIIPLKQAENRARHLQ